MKTTSLFLGMLLLLGCSGLWATDARFVSQDIRLRVQGISSGSVPNGASSVENRFVSARLVAPGLAEYRGVRVPVTHMSPWVGPNFEPFLSDDFFHELSSQLNRQSAGQLHDEYQTYSRVCVALSLILACGGAASAWKFFSIKDELARKDCLLKRRDKLWYGRIAVGAFALGGVYSHMSRNRPS